MRILRREWARLAKSVKEITNLLDATFRSRVHLPNRRKLVEKQNDAMHQKCKGLASGNGCCSNTSGPLRPTSLMVRAPIEQTITKNSLKHLMDAGDSAGMLSSSTTHLPPVLDKTFALASATTRFLVEYSSGVTTNAMITGTAVVSNTSKDALVFHSIVQQMFRHHVNKIRSGVPVKEEISSTSRAVIVVKN